MPHLQIDYANIPEIRNDILTLFGRLKQAYGDGKVIAPANVKMRAIGTDFYEVSGGNEPYLHISLAMMSGPGEAEKSELADALFTAAAETYPWLRQITVDIRDMNPATYRKRSANWKPAE